MNPAAHFRRRLRLAIALPALPPILLAAALFGLVAHLNSALERVGRADRLIARAGGPAASPRPDRGANPRVGGVPDGPARHLADDPERSRRPAEARAQGPDPGASAAVSGAAARGPLAAFLEAEVGDRDRRSGAARAAARTLLAAACGGAIFLGILLTYASWRQSGALCRAFDAAVEVAQTVADRQERERLGLLSEAMKHYAIFSLTAEGRISGWNVAAERTLGYREDDVLARHVTCLYSEEDVRADRPHLDLHWATREGRLEDERWLTRKDGFRFKARVALMAIRDADGALCGFTSVIHEAEE